ncbi:MAG: hypothetical protein GEU86_22780 [Actinophytocola sp.]|nr:hypothetical protein [Actinophytocola sp.]
MWSDWYNDGAFGPPQYETYHIRQLIPWVDSYYSTIPGRSGRAIAGLSMGGFGAFSYAARHPDLFVAAASFSGAVDTNVVPVLDGSGEAILNGGRPGDTWGPRATEEVRWRAHNPWDLAGNLRGLQLTLRTGNGLPGGPYGGGDPIETWCWKMSTNVHERLVSLDIPHVWDDYGAGGHTWPYWQRSLRQTLSDLMDAFADPHPAPVPFAYTAVDPAYSVYGWTVRLHRAALEFSTLDDASPSGFRLSGSGSAKVTTAGYYPPGRAYRVTVTGPYEQTSATVVADRDRRLTIPVTLGPPNPHQQYTVQAAATGSLVHTATVTITPATGRA